MVQPVQALVWIWEGCAGDGALALLQPTSTLTLLLHHISCSGPSPVILFWCIFWNGTLHAEAHRFAKLLWTKSRETASAQDGIAQPTGAANHSTPHC